LQLGYHGNGRHFEFVQPSPPPPPPGLRTDGLLNIIMSLFYNKPKDIYFSIKLYENLQEYHMPCEVMLVRVDFFKMAAVDMETAKMLKINT
jgi:hypothetical protein